MNLDNLIGNNEIKISLQKAFSSNKLSNTLLFSGPQGVGKFLFSIHLATMLMHPETDIDKGALEKIKANNHPDLHIFEPEGKTSLHSIASIRDLIEQVYMAPFEAEAKVFIINDAHRILPPSANALLKTLEEPTFDSYIILISNKVEELLPTIVSRCFRFNFKTIKEEEIIEFLKTKKEIPAMEAEKIAKISAGSIGKAIELASHPDYLQKRDLFVNILAKKNISTYYDLSNELAKLEDIYVKSFSQIEKPIKFYQEIDLLLEKLLYWFRDLHLLKVKADEKYLFFSDKLDLLKNQDLENFPSLDKISNLIDEVKLSLARNIKLKYALENFFIKINFI